MSYSWISVSTGTSDLPEQHHTQYIWEKCQGIITVVDINNTEKPQNTVKLHLWTYVTIQMPVWLTSSQTTKL